VVQYVLPSSAYFVAFEARKFEFLGWLNSEVQSGCCFALGSVDLLIGQLVVGLVHLN
jgi:hypothetical protein